MAAALESYKSINHGRYPWSNRTGSINDRYLQFTKSEKDKFFDTYINSDKNVYDPLDGDYKEKSSISAYNFKYNPNSAGGGYAGGF